MKLQFFHSFLIKNQVFDVSVLSILTKSSLFVIYFNSSILFTHCKFCNIVHNKILFYLAF